MSGFPRWIRREPAHEVASRSVAAMWAAVCQSVPSMLNPRREALVVLPDERNYPLGSLGRMARISRVCGTGGEQDTGR